MTLFCIRHRIQVANFPFFQTQILQATLSLTLPSHRTHLLSTELGWEELIWSLPAQLGYRGVEGVSIPGARGWREPGQWEGEKAGWVASPAAGPPPQVLCTVRIPPPPERAALPAFLVAEADQKSAYHSNWGVQTAVLTRDCTGPLSTGLSDQKPATWQPH